MAKDPVGVVSSLVFDSVPIPCFPISSADDLRQVVPDSMQEGNAIGSVIQRDIAHGLGRVLGVAIQQEGDLVPQGRPWAMAWFC